MNLLEKYDAIDLLIHDLSLQVKPTATGNIITAIDVLKKERSTVRSHLEAQLNDSR